MKPRETWLWCEKDMCKQALSVCKVRCPESKKKHCKAWLGKFAEAVRREETCFK